jgi:signal transduction histidine kinase
VASLRWGDFLNRTVDGAIVVHRDAPYQAAAVDFFAERLGAMNNATSSAADGSGQRWVDQSIEIARIAGSLAHEIKNPLSVIRMNMDLLAEDLGPGETLRDRRALAKVAVVQSQCQRLQNLLDDFLGFAKAQRLELRPADLNEQVEAVLDFMGPKLAQAGIEVVRYLLPDLPYVHLDRQKMHAALLNLVLNAQQAMPDGGRLWVRTRITPNGVALDFIDTGCGMEDETLLHIFEPFYTTKSGGSGLGLPTTRRIIEGHNGTISVQSQVDHGTQFTIELPMPPRLTAAEGT